MRTDSGHRHETIVCTGESSLAQGGIGGPLETEQPPTATNIKVSDTGYWLKTMIFSSSSVDSA